MDEKNVLSKLRENGIRLTPQRMAIIKALSSHLFHPSAHDIYLRLKNRYPSLSLTTVYNTLGLLAELKVIQEIKIDPNKTLYDANINAHDHFYCTGCKTVADVDKIKISTDAYNSLRIKGFEVLDTQISILGYCQRCIQDYYSAHSN